MRKNSLRSRVFSSREVEGVFDEEVSGDDVSDEKVKGDVFDDSGGGHGGVSNRDVSDEEVEGGDDEGDVEGGDG